MRSPLVRPAGTASWVALFAASARAVCALAGRVAGAWSRRAALACVAMAGASAWAGKAHEHGAAQLSVALDGPQLSLVWVLPQDSLLGFEHAPRTPAQRQAAAAALARLRDAPALVQPSPPAQCTLQAVAVDAPALVGPSGGTSATAAAHAHADTSGHADVEASYTYTCARAAALVDLRLRVFEQWPRVERLEVQAALPGGQFKRLLRRASGATVLVLSPAAR